MKIVFFLKKLYGGGAEKLAVNLANKLCEKGYIVDFLLSDVSGPYLHLISDQINIVDLKCKNSKIKWVNIVKYFKEAEPDIALTFLPYANLTALILKRITKMKTKVIINEPGNLDFTERYDLRLLAPFIYPIADAIIVNTKGLKSQMQQKLFLKCKDQVKLIYNPVITDEIYALADEPLEDLWIKNNRTPFIIGVGRLDGNKDFSTLLYALSILRKKRDVNLVILGEGIKRMELECLAEKLNLSKHVYFAGFVANPYKYMKQALVFVLSSQYETFSNVIVEALGLGIPVVSTDCPFGPVEILGKEICGKLVPRKNPIMMAEAIDQVIKDPFDHKILINRAQDFTVEKISQDFIHLFNALCNKEV